MKTFRVNYFVPLIYEIEHLEYTKNLKVIKIKSIEKENTIMDI
jgi:hypothetical protein